jgi:AWS domain
VPLGVEIPRVAINELPRCQCRPTNDQPCGPDSDCINRYMLYECHPSVCPNGDQCMNQRFQRRQYPPVKLVRTEKRGWGLMACADIQKVR